MEILRNNKGGVKLCLDGFMYTKKTASNVAIIWGCSGKTAFHCYGKVRTTLEMENPRLISEHNHPADPTAVEVAKFRIKLKEQASTSNGKDDQPAIEDDRKKMSALEEAAVHSSRFILCAQKKLAEPAPGVRQPCNSHGLDGENPQVTSSRFILYARKREDGPAPGVRQPGNSQGLDGEIVHVTPRNSPRIPHEILSSQESQIGETDDFEDDIVLADLKKLLQRLPSDDENMSPDDMENPRLISEHNHPADPTAVEVAKFRTTLKEQASTSNGKDDQPTIEDDRKKMSALEEAAVHSSRFILCAQKKLAEPAPGVRQPCNSHGLEGENPQVTSSRFILYARKREDGPAPGVRQPGNSQGLDGEIVHVTPSSYIMCARKKLAEPAPGVSQTCNSQGLEGENPQVTSSRFILYARKREDGPAPGVRQPGNSQGLDGEIVHVTPSSFILCARKKLAEPAPGVRQPDSQGFRRETVDMTPSSFISTSHKQFAKPLAEAMELDITAKSGIGSEKIDITQKFGGLADGVMTPQVIPRRDIRKGCISTDQNRNFTVTTVSSSISPVGKTFTAPADGVVLSPETPKAELRKEMTDMTPSIFISPATKEAAKSAPRDDVRNEKVDMMPSIYILNAQKKATETIDLSETSSRTDEEEDEIHLSVGHKGRNEDHGSEDGHRDEILTEETSSIDDQFRLGRKMERASTVFNSPSVGRRSVENPPTTVIVNMPNGVFITESEMGSDGKASLTNMILKPRVDICRDEVIEYLYTHGQFVGTNRSIEFCCPKRIQEKKCFDYEPKPKRKKRNKNLVYQEPVKQKPVYLSPSEAKACLSRKPGGSMAPLQTCLQCNIVEKAKKNVPWAKEIGIQNISRLMDSSIGHCSKPMPKLYERLICKHTDPSEKMDKEQEPSPGKNGRKRRKVVTPEESLETGEQGEEIEQADGHNKTEVVDEEQVYIDEDWTEECQEDDDEFVEQKEDEHLVVKKQIVVNREVLENVEKEEVDQILVNKEVLENVEKEEVDQIVVSNKCKDRVVNKEQNVVRVHKWVVNFLPDEGQFVLQEVDEDQTMKDVDKIVSSKALVKQNVVKKEVDQIVVNKPDEDHFVERVKDEKQSLEQRVGETSVVQKKDKGQFGDEEQEQNVIREESENVILVKHEVEEANVVKEKAEQYVVHMEEDWVVVMQEEEQSTREVEDEEKFVFQGTEIEQLLVNGEEEKIVMDEERIVVNKEVQEQNVIKKAEHILIQEEEEDCIVVDQENEEHIVVKERVQKVVVQDAVDDCIVIEQEGEPSVVREEVQQNVVILIDE
ncbi:uncharacterized protein LOC124277547 [Haliotis rubra]|uniref:uncharacterized protein LOC124277547 n=1 Tax=Haliotis rubra TaxID=36100 RepID=UPI001EE5B509|nr:uncharacterized protein LOC124277547 [Haliotis rubra]